MAREFDPFRYTGGFGPVTGNVVFPKPPARPMELAETVGKPGSMERFLAPAYKETEVTATKYIVWNPASHLPPKVTHPDRQTAIRVAGRMAHENPGQEFFVCKLVNSAKKPVPVEVNYQDLDR